MGEQDREQTSTNDDIFTLNEAAEYLHVHPSTIYKMLKRQEIRGVSGGASSQILTPAA